MAKKSSQISEKQFTNKQFKNECTGSFFTDDELRQFEECGGTVLGIVTRRDSPIPHPSVLGSFFYAIIPQENGH